VRDPNQPTEDSEMRRLSAPSAGADAPGAPTAGFFAAAGAGAAAGGAAAAGFFGGRFFRRGFFGDDFFFDFGGHFDFFSFCFFAAAAGR